MQRARRTFVHVRYPWRAAIERGHARPARFYIATIAQALHYGVPASRRFGSAWALAARPGLPERPLAAALRALPGRARPDLERLADSLEEDWPAVTAAPSPPPELSLLALQRSAAMTVFAFGSAPHPLLVLKLPAGGDGRVDLEMRWLAEAAGARVAPRPLGQVGEARVQEGLAGAPLRMEPLSPRGAAALAWNPALESVADGLVRLGEATAKREPPDEVGAAIERALGYERLDAASRRLLAAAWRDVRASRASVLRHRDTSPQNCLMRDGELAGIVDWEIAVPRGGPGFDVLNLALSYTEHAVGLTRWSQERVLDTFARAWRGSPFWREARAAAGRSAVAGGASERDLEPLELVFFGSRVGDRLERPGSFATTADTAARALAVVASG